MSVTDFDMTPSESKSEFPGCVPEQSARAGVILSANNAARFAGCTTEPSVSAKSNRSKPCGDTHTTAGGGPRRCLEEVVGILWQSSCGADTYTVAEKGSVGENASSNIRRQTLLLVSNCNSIPGIHAHLATHSRPSRCVEDTFGVAQFL